MTECMLNKTLVRKCLDHQNINLEIIKLSFLKGSVYRMTCTSHTRKDDKNDENLLGREFVEEIVKFCKSDNNFKRQQKKN